MILHQVESLAAAGVTDIVLAVNYRPEIMTAALKKVQRPSVETHVRRADTVDGSTNKSTTCESNSPSRPNL